MKCYVPMPVPRVAWHVPALRHAAGSRKLLRNFAGVARNAVVAASVAAGGTGSGLVEVACSRAMADVHRELRAEVPAMGRAVFDDLAGNSFQELSRVVFPESPSITGTITVPRVPVMVPVAVPVMVPEPRSWTLLLPALAAMALLCRGRR